MGVCDFPLMDKVCGAVDFATNPAGAVTDAAARASGADERPATPLGAVDASAVTDWARSEALDTVLVPYAPVGPAQERLEGLRSALASDGVGLVTVRRPWDSRAWPFASRGFFPFREKIPQLLRTR